MTPQTAGRDEWDAILAELAGMLSGVPLLLMHSVVQATSMLFLPGCSSTYFTWIPNCKHPSTSQVCFRAGCTPREPRPVTVSRGGSGGEVRVFLECVTCLGWVFRVSCNVLCWNGCSSLFIGTEWNGMEVVHLEGFYSVHLPQLQCKTQHKWRAGDEPCPGNITWLIMLAPLPGRY